MNEPNHEGARADGRALIAFAILILAGAVMVGLATHAPAVSSPPVRGGDPAYFAGLSGAVIGTIGLIGFVREYIALCKRR